MARTEYETMITGIRAGLKTLREAHVEPMVLSLTASDGTFGWQLCKYKALPGHPKPGNAGNGWSHPSNTSAFKAAHAPLNWPVGGSFPQGWNTTLDDAKSFAREIAVNSGFGTDYTIECAWSGIEDMTVPTAAGVLIEIDLERGGSKVWDYYPSAKSEISHVDKDGNPVDAAKEEEVVGKHRNYKKAEQASTDAYMTPPTVSEPITISGAWYVDSLPGGIVVELIDGKMVSFGISPFRAVDQSDLTPYTADHPRKQHGTPVPAPIYPFYGLEKSEESLSETIRLRVSPSEKAAFEAYAASLDPKKNISDVLREFVRSII